jgi:hypothetical protein
MPTGDAMRNGSMTMKQLMAAPKLGLSSAAAKPSTRFAFVCSSLSVLALPALAEAVAGAIEGQVRASIQRIPLSMYDSFTVPSLFLFPTH